MKCLVHGCTLSLTAGAFAALLVCGQSSAEQVAKAPAPVRNPSGYALTYSATGFIDTKNEFFQSLGSNGRSCSSCHVEAQNWSITPAGVQARFDATAGTDPVFRRVDGANSPNMDVSSLEARRSAYSMLLKKGLIRVGIRIPANAEFDLIQVDDPYGYASASELSLFRRPLPSTNLKFLSTVMWDGRETFKDPGSSDCIVGTDSCFATIHFDLASQANDATRGHAEAAQPLSTGQQASIVAFETGLFTAQIFDDAARRLTAHGVRGGPRNLSAQDFYFGINDVVSGDYRTHAPFNPVVFSLYDRWNRAHVGREADSDEDADVVRARQAVARGERLFNTKPIAITGVKGLNDDLDIPVLNGTCTTCHDTPGSGNHSIPAPLDIGLTDAARRTPDQPLYTLRNHTSGATLQTTDPGRALFTGKWKDIGRFKGPVLRGLAGRAPYFHNGSAAGLTDAVQFYNQRFDIGFTDDEMADLVAFLRTL